MQMASAEITFPRQVGAHSSSTHVQTDIFERADSGTQCPKARVESETQTDTTDAAADRLDETSLSFLNLADLPRAAAFLAAVGPRMLQELQTSTPSSSSSLSPNSTSAAVLEEAMESLASHITAATYADDGDGNGTLLQVFRHPFAQPDEDASSSSSAAGATAETRTSSTSSSLSSSSSYLPCQALSWNASGALFAGAFGHRDHPGWCHHRAGVAVWNAFRNSSETSHCSQQQQQSNTANATTTHSSSSWKPLIVLDTDTCVTSVAFHPEDGGLIAGGTSTGDVFIWDINRGSSNNKTPGKTMVHRGETSTSSTSTADPLLHRSRTDDFIHREPILSLLWSFDALSRMYTLISLSREGKIAVWSLANSLSYPIGTAQLGVSAKSRLLNGVISSSGGGGGGKRGDANDNDIDDDDDNDDDGNDPVAARRRRRAREALDSSNTKGDAVVPAGGTGLAFPFSGSGGSSSSGGGGRSGTANNNRGSGSGGLFLASGEGGGVFSCTLSISASALAAASQPEGSIWRPTHRPGSLGRAENTLVWEQAAAECLNRVPDGEKAKLVRGIERFVRDSGASVVTLGALYAARPEGVVYGSQSSGSSSSTSSFLFPNPVRFSLSPHAGPVYSLVASPFHRNLLATAGADGRLCIRSALLAQPLLVFEPGAAALASASNSGGRVDFGDTNNSSSGSSGSRGNSVTHTTHYNSSSSALIPVNSLAWSRVRPLVIAAGCGDGSIVVYDLYVSTAFPSLVLRIDDSRQLHHHHSSSSPPSSQTISSSTSSSSGSSSTTGSSSSSSSSSSKSAAASSSSSSMGGSVNNHIPSSIQALAFNPSQRRVFVAADTSGRVQVWKLPWRFGRPEGGGGRDDEEEALNRFMRLDNTNSNSGSNSGSGGNVAEGVASSTNSGEQQQPSVAGFSMEEIRDLEGTDQHSNSLGALMRAWKV